MNILNEIRVDYIYSPIEAEQPKRQHQAGILNLAIQNRKSLKKKVWQTAKENGFLV